MRKLNRQRKLSEVDRKPSGSAGEERILKSHVQAKGVAHEGPLTDMISEGVVVVYLDDILIFTKDLDEHHQITQRVLGRLAEHELYLRPEKCEFEKMRIEYLGLIISENKVEMDPVKVAGVAEWPEPTSKREVQSFLGLVNFYRWFVKDFSHHA
jgi:hypothetical protein